MRRILTAAALSGCAALVPGCKTHSAKAPAPPAAAPNESVSSDMPEERAPAPPPDTRTVEAVVMVHGLMRSSRSFDRMGKALRETGFRTVPFDYPSTQNDIATHGRSLRKVLDQLEDDAEVERIHLVTHSMGGLITRSALGTAPPSKVSRVVMLTPPNQGSAVAGALKGVLGKLLPALDELSDNEDSAAKQLPVPPDVEIGILAVTADHAVGRESTHLEGEKDHIVISGMHSSVLFQRESIEQTIHFFRTGLFRPE